MKEDVIPWFDKKCRLWANNIHVLKPITLLLGMEVHVYLKLCQSTVEVLLNWLRKVSTGIPG